MGRVFAALDVNLGREVAIKILASRDLTPAILRRFEQEARAAALLTHPNIIAIYDIGQHDGVPFIVSELLHGETLRRLMDRRQLPLEEALGYALQLITGLAAAHDKGVVHRDLKPENLFVTTDGQLKILDFGIAKLAADPVQSTLTDPGTILGTVAYMSPEQLCGDRVDARSDIFSFGAVLHEMISGEQPFARASTMQSGAAVLHDETPVLPSTIPNKVASVVRRCLEKGRERRYQSAPELLAAIEESVADFGARRRGRLNGAMAALMRAARLPRSARPRLTATRIAVLPFVDLSADRGQQHFSDGLTEDVQGALSRVEGLRVAARTSSLPLKGKNRDPRAIGKLLDVTHLVEGSVRVDGGRMRVTANLIDARDGLNLWSESYDRDSGRALAMEDELALAIVRALVPRLPGAVSGPAPGLGRDAAARELYLKGRYYRERYRSDALVKARDCFRQAVECDPRDALSHAALADAWTALYETGRVPAHEALPEATKSVERALALDAVHVEAHAVLGRIRQARLDWNGAERAFRRAIELRPNFARPHQFYSLMLAWNGRFDEALEEGNFARQLEPMWLTLYYLLTYVHFVRREFATAIELAKTAVELDSTHPMPHDHLGRIYLEMGRYREAADEFRHGSAYQSMVPGFLGHALARCGEVGEAKRLLEEAPRPSAKALIALGLGDQDAALGWMEDAFDENDIFIKVLKVEPVLDGLRSLPRFRSLLAKASFQGETV